MLFFSELSRSRGRSSVLRKYDNRLTTPSPRRKSAEQKLLSDHLISPKIRSSPRRTNATKSSWVTGRTLIILPEVHLASRKPLLPRYPKCQTCPSTNNLKPHMRQQRRNLGTIRRRPHSHPYTKPAYPTSVVVKCPLIPPKKWLALCDQVDLRSTTARLTPSDKQVCTVGVQKC